MLNGAAPGRVEHYLPDVQQQSQLSLFEAPAPTSDLPDGLRYAPMFLTPREERALVAAIEPLPFKPFEFHGYLGNRRVVSFGWRYRYDGTGLGRADDPPDFLLGLREEAAAFAEIEPEALVQALVTEYAPGAAIGWHRDRPQFGRVVGVSLLSPCRFRLRRRTTSGFERAAFTAEPRSAYLLSGPARSEWEHSIPAVDALRYSVTFRELKEQPA
jgi:alkylated DNA repair dioxygenase AlkB